MAHAGETEGVPRSNRPRRARDAAAPTGARRGGRRGADGVQGRGPEPDDDLEARLVHGGGRLEEHADGAWRVRAVPGAATTKGYLCPGCRQTIAAGTPHLVAWPAEQLGAFGGPGDRRHWHTPCWAARDRRR